MTKNKIAGFITKYIPGSLIAIFASVIANNILTAYFPTIALSGKHLVSLPSIYDTLKLSNFSNLFAFDLSAFNNLLVYKYAFFIAAIGSIETLLSIEASDKLDKEKRITPTGRELKAQGVGNFLSGLLGGLPITSVVIRTSVNIENNAQTKVSTIVHGVLILFSLLFLTPIINQIPLASLACILIVTGYKLTHERLIVSMFKRGANKFVPFVSTIIAILATDLLIGVFIGLLVSIFFILKNYYNLFNIKFITSSNSNEYTIQFGDYITFLSKPSIAKTLANIPANCKLNLDFSNCSMLDFEIQELINDFMISAVNKAIAIIVIQNNNNIINFAAA
jgi:carbonic anhydrase